MRSLQLTRRQTLTLAAVSVAGLWFLATGPGASSPDKHRTAPVGSPGASTSAVEPEAGSSAPEGVIAFAVGGLGQIVVTHPDRSGLTELATNASCCPTMSPDGDHIAYTFTTANGKDAVAIDSMTGGERRRAAAKSRLELIPGVWAPDSAQLALGAHDRAHPGLNGVMVLGPSGKLHRLTRTRGQAFDLPFGWAPDGSRILFIRVPSVEDYPLHGNLFSVAAAGGPIDRLNARGTFVWYLFVPPGNFLPDSKHVTFVQATAENNDGSVIVARADGASRRTLTRPSHYTTTAQASPDGAWIAYDVVRTDVAMHDLFLIRPDGTGRQKIESVESGVCCAVWSPDGERLLYNRAISDQANNLEWVSIDGSDGGTITSTGGQWFQDYSWGVAGN